MSTAAGPARRVAASGGALPPPAPLRRTALIGRDDEMSALAVALRHPPAIVVVEGETGIGKTSLVHAVLDDPAFDHVATLVGHCRPFHEPQPLAPLAEALAGTVQLLRGRTLSPVAGALRGLLPELTDVLPAPPQPLPGARGEQLRIFRALVTLLDAVGPAILVLEDVHWMDAATEEFLRHLATAVPATLSVAVTFRPEDMNLERIDWFARRAPHVTTSRLTLHPLDAAGVAAMAANRLQVAAVPAGLARLLYERTGGLPFAVDEVLRLMQERSQATGTDWSAHAGSDRGPVPPAVRDTILLRLRRLSPVAQDVAAAAAVLATPAEPGVLAEVAGHGDAATVAALAELFGAWLLHEPSVNTSEFRHALARQAVEDCLAPPVLRRLHARAASALERTGEAPLAAVARHFREAGLTLDWLRCAEAAAATAAQVGDHAMAVDLLEELLALDCVDGDTLCRLALAYGEAAVQARLHRRAAAVLARAVPRVPVADGRRGRVRFKRACLLSQAGAVEEVSGEVQKAIAELDGLPEAGVLMTYLAYPWVATLHRSEHLEWLGRAREVARARQDEDLCDRIDNDVAAVLAQVGDPAGWSAVRTRLALDGLPARERVRLAYNAAHAALMTGAYPRARELLDLAGATVVDTPRFEAPLAGLQAWWRWATGAWDGLDAAVADLAESGADSPTASTVARVIAASLEVARGDLDRGLADLAAVASVAIDAGELVPHLVACGEMARAALGRGDATGGLAAACRGLALVERKGMWAWAGEVVPWAVQGMLARDDPAGADELVTRLGRELRQLDAPAAVAGHLQSRAAIAAASATPSVAAGLYAEAARAWGDLPRPHRAALCAAEHGRLLASIDPAAAAAVLRDCYERLCELGARWDARQVSRALRGLGEGIGHRGGRRGYGPRLSPREREVAVLAAAGRTNRQIAESLVLSPRTVERHVANVLRKLGVRSRRALAADLLDTVR